MAVKHSTRAHAVLSASASSRWLACPPSAKLCAEIPDTTTDYAREGTCAHELAEYKVNKMLGIDAADPTENLDFYDEEMAECTDSYAQYIAEEISKYSDPVVKVTAEKLHSFRRGLYTSVRGKIFTCVYIGHSFLP